LSALDRRLAIAIAVLLLVAVIGWNWYDVKIFLNWVLAAKQLSIVKIYEAYELYGPQFRAVYPPLPILIFVATDSFVDDMLSSLSKVCSYISSNIAHILITYSYRLLLKIPVVIPTIVLAIILARIYRKRELAYWLLLGVPTLITVGTYQFDSLLALFLALSVIALTKWGRPRLSALFLALATLTKPIAAVFYIPIATYIGRRREALGYLALFTAVSLAFIAPFALLEPKAFIENVLEFHMGRPPQYLSIWNVPVLLTMRNPTVVSIVDKLWVLGYALAIALAIALLKPRPGDEGRMLALIVAIGVVTTFVNKVVNPNYLMWVYPEALILAFVYGRRALAKLYNIYAAIGVTWPAIYVTIPALAGAPMYVEEVRNYISARRLLLKSLSPPLNKTFETIFRSLDSSEIHSYTLSLYHHLYIVGAILICVYASIGLYLLRELVRGRGV